MFDVKIINTGYFLADGGAMFGAIPKRAWKRRYPSDGDNLCPLAMRCALAVSADRKILIDTGMGNKHLKEVSYYQPYDLVEMEEALNKYGYTSSDITDVVLTHLHFDHCGYATVRNKTDEIVPSFPNARYWLSRKQWANFLSPNRLEKESMFADNILPVYDKGLLHLVDEDIAFTNNIQLKLFGGHTAGQLVVYINTNDGTYTFPGDLIPTASHVSLDWISAYDVCALTSLSEKERFLEEAEKENYKIIYCHDAIISQSKVKKVNNNYRATDIKK